MHFPENHWYPVLETSQLTSTPQKIKRFNRYLIVWRKTNGEIVCMDNRCPHRGASLAEGKLVGDRIQCPYHGIRYDSQGQCVEIPQNGTRPIPAGFGVRTYKALSHYGLVWVWWGVPSKESALPSFEDMPQEHPRVSAGSKEIPVSFLRWMESMLDSAHFTYVHPYPKLPNGGAVAHRYSCKVEGNRIETEGAFAAKVGQETPGPSFKNHVFFPALMFTEMESEKVKGIVASCPVDDTHSWIAVRYYQNLITWPILSALYNRFFTWLALGPILNQDLRVFAKQQPSWGGISHDRLVGIADQGIVAYWGLWKKSELQNLESYRRETPSQELPLSH